MSHPLLLHWRSARHMKPSQLAFYVLRRFFPSRSIEPSASPAIRKGTFDEPPCATNGIYVNNTTFRFLNVEVDLGKDENALDWAARSEQRLWQYNLHYFDYLREPSRPPENKNKLIQSWISGNPPGSTPGWEPFTVSLRIVNWIFYLRSLPIDAVPVAWLDNLWLQARWLEKNDERHILANHYFENLKALLFAGCFFNGEHAARWRKRAVRKIIAQLREQTLADGGHYERSHQYHCLMLENYLDIVNLGKVCPDLVPADLMSQLQSTVAQGLDYLNDTLFPDGTIPLFNDAAFGVALSPAELFAYAERLGMPVKQDVSKSFKVINRPDSGIYGGRIGRDMFVIDCGDIGPSYQPGHTHCDFLSYELMLSGRRVIVDSGVCEYEPGPLRQYARSTRAHNTVVVDGGEQSEIWGEFRVARRARKIAAETVLHGHKMKFRGAFRGFYNARGRIEHERSVSLELAATGEMFQTVVVTDLVRGRGRHVAESLVHLHPAVELEDSQDGEIYLLDRGTLVAAIQITDSQEYSIDSSCYCPEFGRRIPNRVLILRKQGRLPLTIQYEIKQTVSIQPGITSAGP